jgi:hypothetical protein
MDTFPAVGCLAPFAAGEDIGPGVSWGGCDTIFAPAGAADVGGGWVELGECCNKSSSNKILTSHVF